MSTIEKTKQQSSMFGYHSHWLKICLIVMFLLAALIRRDEIRAPGHLIEREYNSAIFARSFFMKGNDKMEPWQKDIAFAARDQLPLLEPPLTEYLVSLVYRVMDREEIWYSRYLTGFFWLVGGFFIFKIVKILESADMALVATGYYLFTPWGIIISRSFQPDALMMMMFLGSLYSIVLYFEKPTWCQLLLAGFISGISLLFRPLILFSLYGAFIAMSIHKNNCLLHVFDKKFAVFLFLSIVFPLAFYGYGVFVTGSLLGQASLSFRPYLLTRSEFWMGWFENGVRVSGNSLFILAIFGFFLLRSNLTRFMIAGLSFGYFVFGLIFTFHIYSHPYYHIQLFPIIGICISPILFAVANSLEKVLGRNWWIPLLTGVFIALYFSYSEVKSTYYTPTFEDPSLASEIGDLVDHSAQTVFVAYHYGLPLMYYGQISGSPWPVSIDSPFYRRPGEKGLSVQERMDGLGFNPEYFVITNFDLYNQKNKDLKGFLEANCKVYEQTDQYLIYGSCQN